jgi:hypothetical protein
MVATQQIQEYGHMPKPAPKQIRQLKPEHKAAADFFLSGMSKKASTMKAGYSAESTRDLFARKDVREYISAVRGEWAEATGVDREYVLRELKAIVDASIGDAIEDDGSFSVDALGRDEKSSLTSISITETRGAKKYSKTKRQVSVKTPDKVAALREIASILGLKEEKVKLGADQELMDLMRQGFNDGPPSTE